MENEELLASEIESVGSCDSLLREEDEGPLSDMSYESIYSRTHAGDCLEVVLREMMESGDINVIQRMDLLKEFNRIYLKAFAHCQSRLHLSVNADLTEYSLVEGGAVFDLKVCNLFSTGIVSS
jgi:hypothetical protein